MTPVARSLNVELVAVLADVLVDLALDLPSIDSLSSRGGDLPSSARRACMGPPRSSMTRRKESADA